MEDYDVFKQKTWRLRGTLLKPSGWNWYEQKKPKHCDWGVIMLPVSNHSWNFGINTQGTPPSLESLFSSVLWLFFGPQARPLLLVRAEELRMCQLLRANICIVFLSGFKPISITFLSFIRQPPPSTRPPRSENDPSRLGATDVSYKVSPYVVPRSVTHTHVYRTASIDNEKHVWSVSITDEYTQHNNTVVENTSAQLWVI